MTKHSWDEFLTERDKQVFSAAGFGTRAGFGKRPAVLVIDVSYNFTGDKPKPVLEFNRLPVFIRRPWSSAVSNQACIFILSRRLQVVWVADLLLDQRNDR
jgi:hypothetical protein